MIVMAEDTLHDQAGMERAFRTYFQTLREESPDTLNAMLNADFLACDRERMTVTLRAETKPWMTNPGNILHGGVTAAYLDLAMGLLCRYFTGGRMTPTIHVDVTYLRTITVGDALCFRASMVKAGGTICFTEASLWGEDRPDRPLASATGAYHVTR